MIKTNQNWREIRILYEKMTDPFETIALQSVSNILKQNLEETEVMFYEHMRPEGVARKFWSVPAELLHEEKGYVIGNIFVLAQVAITQSAILFQRLREYCKNKDCFPKNKKAILAFKSNTIENFTISEIALIDSVANYFKHQNEWPLDWTSDPDNKKNSTMEIVKEIGMEPQSLTDNIEIALHTLRVWNDISSITNIVQQWRECLTKELLKDPAIKSSVN